MKSSVLTNLALLSGLLALSNLATAGVVTCGDSYRTANLSSASSCYAQTLGSTAKVGDINKIAGGSWTLVDALTGNGANGWLTISNGEFGTGDTDGSWSISNVFWQNFSSALISMHVGGGQKDAVDNFEWVLTPASLSGNWSYDLLKGKGGGLSNIKLWGTGTPAPVTPPVVVVPPTVPPVQPPVITPPVQPPVTPPVVVVPEPTPPPVIVPPVITPPVQPPVIPPVVVIPDPTPEPIPEPPVTPPVVVIPPAVIPPAIEPGPSVPEPVPPLPPVVITDPLPTPTFDPEPVLETQPPASGPGTSAPVATLSEPDSIALILFGLVCLLLTRRRQALHIGEKE